MDVAKCIKLYANMDPDKNYLEQEIIPNDIKLLALPTTAGTGSEATRYAVIYYNGEKQSVTSESCIPGTVFMDASVLKTLPVYQKESTMMDALCHCIESYWSVNSTDESKGYSRQGIQMILANKGAYLANVEAGNANMLQAANLGGKAINITQTTAGHAMCYKLTSLYEPILAKGKDVAIVVRKGALTYDEKVEYKNDNTMLQEEIIQHIVRVTGEDPIISTTGKASRELFETRVANGQGHQYDFLTVGSMGHSSSIALGVTLNKPETKAVMRYLTDQQTYKRL